MRAELRTFVAAPAALLALLSGCASEPGPHARVAVTEPVVVVEPASAVVAGDVNLRAILAFYRKSRAMAGPEMTRERAALQGRSKEPLEALRLAVLLGHERSDLPRALGLLDGIAKGTSTQAVALQPLARLLSDQYAERLKLETQVERLGASNRDAERRAAQLQEKIDALAEIERSLPGRPAPPVPDADPGR